jgi:formamidopyrimidine-DNA glycosylase
MQSRGRRLAIKSFLMDSKIVAGVGNIYANEALFLAGIHPQRAAGRVSRDRYECLAEAVRAVLTASIRKGGTTLRDFVNGEGNPGYFRPLLRVYGKPGEPCPVCGQPIRERRIGQRSSFFCPTCQH